MNASTRINHTPPRVSVTYFVTATAPALLAAVALPSMDNYQNTMSVAWITSPILTFTKAGLLNKSRFYGDFQLP